jgi:hypothetical protein
MRLRGYQGSRADWITLEIEEDGKLRIGGEIDCQLAVALGVQTVACQRLLEFEIPEYACPCCGVSYDIEDRYLRCEDCKKAGCPPTAEEANQAREPQGVL